MKKQYTLKSVLAGLFVMLLICCQSSVYGQISVNATGGVPFASYATISDAFTAINAGTHTSSILISVNGNTTEPVAPVYLAASGQGAASYTGIAIKPTVVATIAGATSPGSAVINMDGADNVTIDGSITLGGTTRDLTIQNTAANTVLNVACIRLMGRTTLGLGATNITISNCNIIGNTAGNNGLSGSTVNSSYGIYAGSTIATTMAATTGGADYDNLLIQNNFITNAYIGVNVIGLVASQADNLQIIGNTIGSLAFRIGFKGIACQHVVGGLASENLVTEIESIVSTSVAGIDFSGTASTGVQIRRNTITNIHSYSTGGWGAYGINITSGINYLISNNVIHGVQAVNYTTSTTFNAFGIRLAGGTGHQVYYNSVNMYGAYTTGSLTNAFSAAFLVSSTAVTGIDVRNNVFANKMTSSATTPEFMAMSFPNAYNFLNANLERNAYFVTADAQHFVGKIGTTVGANNHSTLNNWRLISQVNNASNDVNSQPGAGNSNAPFTADNDLTIPALTVTVMESTALPVAVLGLPNVDRTNTTRPAFGGTNPDMGAYEFNGSAPADLVPPTVSGVSAAPGSSCTNVAHVVTATADDNIGVTSVTLSYSYNGVPQTPISMTLISGTPLSGTWSGTIPAAVGPNVTVTYSVQAADAAPNNSAVVAGTSYADNYLVVTASADQLIATGTGTTVSATTNDPSFARLLISEIIQFKGGTGDGTYPAYIPAVDNDFIEIVNYGNVDADASGYTLTIYGGVNGSYTIPASTIIPSGATLVLAFSGTTVDPGNRYFGMNLLTTSSGVANGYVLRSPLGAIKDVVATNGYVFTGPSGVTAGDWSGNIAGSAGLAGVRRTVATDNNLASDWTLSGAANLTNIGVYNSEITIVPIPLTITWTNDFGPATSTDNPLAVAPFAVAGAYTFYATFFDGTCTAVDSVLITVVAPVAPVASFTATPLVGSAPLVVNFTDQSTNIPTSWLWTVSPSVGVTYIAATTNASQNPVIQFANAGLYTITLFVSNSAGSDDSTIIQYINVNWCASNATNTADTDIGNVTFGSLNNGAAAPVFSNPTANALYTDFTALPAESYGVGMSYPISLSQITGGATFYSAHFNVFIDYDNDGAFDPVTERVFNGATSNVGPVSNVTGSVTIPLAASLGLVRMRVILQEGGTSASPPCGTYAYGETEDYLINIACASAAPIAGTDVICAGDSSLLDAGLTSIQWYADAVTTTVLATGSTYYTGALAATTSYFAAQTDPGCVESPRTEFIVTVNQPSSSSEIASSCDNYFWPTDGNTYTSTGMYSAIVPNAVGCDSTITLDLTILAGSSSTETASACGSYTWSTDGNTYSSTGMYTAVMPNAAGCDSTITLDLTINTATSSSSSVTSCTSYTWSANGTTYTVGGTYNATLVNAAGCDSIATLILTLGGVSNIGVTVASPMLTADLAPGAGISYQWMECVGANFTPIVGATSQSYTATANGSYAVQITQSGCVDTSACNPITGLGINTIPSAKVSIVPNPTDDLVTITFEGSEVNLAILDLNGKVIATSVINSGDQIDLTNYESGVYIFKMYSDSVRTIERVVKH